MEKPDIHGMKNEVFGKESIKIEPIKKAPYIGAFFLIELR